MAYGYNLYIEPLVKDKYNSQRWMNYINSKLKLLTGRENAVIVDYSGARNRVRKSTLESANVQHYRIIGGTTNQFTVIAAIID